MELIVRAEETKITLNQFTKDFNELFLFFGDTELTG